MDFRHELQREAMRQEIEQERERITMREKIREARVKSGEIAPLRIRMSRFLMKAAFAVDSEEGWRYLWKHLSCENPAVRNPEG